MNRPVTKKLIQLDELDLLFFTTAETTDEYNNYSKFYRF